MLQTTPAYELPPSQVPIYGPLSPTPVLIRPMQLADSAAAFSLSELTFLPDGQTTLAEASERQARWDAGLRTWSRWLWQRSQASSWVATRATDGLVIGYARVVRHEHEKREQLTELFVHPAFQSAQVGKALLSAVLTPEVPTGWRREIFAHPDPVPLALYYRCGTFPISTAWYVRVHLQPEHLDRIKAIYQSLDAVGMKTRRASGVQDLGLIGWLDRAVLEIDRSEQHQFMAHELGAHSLLLHRWGRIAAYGTLSAGHVGPVVGESPVDAALIIAAFCAFQLIHGETTLSFWLPGANVAVLRWLREQDIPLRLVSQATLMASDPQHFRLLDRTIFSSPPYLL